MKLLKFPPCSGVFCEKRQEFDILSWILRMKSTTLIGGTYLLAVTRERSRVSKLAGDFWHIDCRTLSNTHRLLYF